MFDVLNLAKIMNRDKFIVREIQIFKVMFFAYLNVLFYQQLKKNIYIYTQLCDKRKTSMTL